MRVNLPQSNVIQDLSIPHSRRTQSQHRIHKKSFAQTENISNHGTSKQATQLVREDPSFSWYRPGPMQITSNLYQAPSPAFPYDPSRDSNFAFSKESSQKVKKV